MPADTPATVWQDSYAPDELLTVPCPFCGSDRARPVAEEFGITIARCADCDLTFTRTPRPGSQDHYRISREAFLTKYGPYVSGEREHPRHRNYVEHLEALEALTSGRDLLDVGAHAGFLLRLAATRGWNARGVEPSEVTSAIARELMGVDVRTGTLDSAGIEDASADVVTLNDVFEHVPDPQAVLASVHRVLRPGGLVFIKVPNVRYVAVKSRLFRTLRVPAEDLWDAREHLVYYDASTLRRALTTAGFDVVDLRVPLPIQAGGRARELARSAGTALARAVPRGVATPLATDLAIVARRP